MTSDNTIAPDSLSTSRPQTAWVDPIAWLAAGVLVAAIVAALITPTLQLLTLGVGTTAVLTLCLALPLDRRIVATAISMVATTSWCWFTVLERTPPPLPESLSITGVVADLPTTTAGTTRVTVSVGNAPIPFLKHRQVTLFVKNAASIEPGMIVQTTATPLTVHQLTQSQQRNSLAANRVVALQTTSVVSQGIDPSPRWWLVRARAAVVRRTQQLWPRPASSLAAGLVVGSRESFSKRLTDAMQATGTTHFVAVSGENVAIVLWVIGALLPRRRPWLRIGLLGVSLLVFVGLTGGSASVVRAGLMAFLLVVASGLGRPTSQLRLLLVVAGALALSNPLIVAGDLGFQLSFLAVFGLIVLTPPLVRWLPLPRWLAMPLAASLAAGFITAPILASSFGMVSLISPLTNLLLVAVVSPTLVLAAVAVAGSFVAPWIGSTLAWLVQPFLFIIVHTILAASNVRWVSQPVAISPMVGWALTAGLMAGGWFLHRRTHQTSTV